MFSPPLATCWLRRMEAARAAAGALFGLTAHDVPDVKEEQDEQRMAPPSVPSFSLNEDDTPPAFPAMNSAQRQAKPSLDVPASSGPSLQPPRGSNTSTAMGGLRAPLMTPPQKLNPPKPRKKVALAPGCSPLDWARLKSTTDLRVGILADAGGCHDATAHYSDRAQAPQQKRGRVDGTPRKSI